MLSKRQFVLALNFLNEQQKKAEQVEKSLRVLAGQSDFVEIAGLFTPYECMIEELVCAGMGLDYSGLDSTMNSISWWIWETDFGTNGCEEISWKEGNKTVTVKIKTAEQLYDYIINEELKDNKEKPLQPRNEKGQFTSKEKVDPSKFWGMDFTELSGLVDQLFGSFKEKK